MHLSASQPIFGPERLSQRCWADFLVLISFLGRVVLMENVLLMCQTDVVGSGGLRLLGTESCWEEEEFLGACWEGLGTTVGPEAGQLCHP